MNKDVLCCTQQQETKKDRLLNKLLLHMLLCFKMLSRSRLHFKVVATLFYGSTILLLAVHVSSIDRHLNFTMTSCLSWWWLTLPVSSLQSAWLVAALSPLSCCSVVFFSPHFAIASPPDPRAQHSAVQWCPLLLLLLLFVLAITYHPWAAQLEPYMWWLSSRNSNSIGWW